MLQERAGATRLRVPSLLLRAPEFVPSASLFHLRRLRPEGSRPNRPILPPEGPSDPSFNDSDVLALSKGLGISKIFAMKYLADASFSLEQVGPPLPIGALSLPASEASCAQAVKFELAHRPMDLGLMDALARQYAIYRGILSAPTEQQQQQQPLSDHARRVWVGRQPVQERGPVRHDEQREEAGADRRRAGAEASTSGALLPAPSAELLGRLTVLRRQLAAGDWAAAAGSLRAWDPELAAPAHLHVAFELAALRLHSMAASGDGGGALQLARAQLGPLARSNASLLPALKQCMLRLVDDLAATQQQQRGAIGEEEMEVEEGQGSAPPLLLFPSCSILEQHALLAATAATNGGQPPQLQLLMGTLLQEHNARYRQDQGSDPVLAVLGLSRLKAPRAPLGSGPGASGQPAGAEDPATGGRMLPADAGGIFVLDTDEEAEEEEEEMQEGEEGVEMHP